MVIRAFPDLRSPLLDQIVGIVESVWLTDTITPDAGPDDSAPGDALELKWEFDEDSQRYYVSFPDDQ